MKKKLKYFHFRPDFYFETANDFCLHLGISQYDIANLTNCHPKTAQKWIKNDNPPGWLLPFLYAVYGGVISCKSFYGWNLNNCMVNGPGIRYGLSCSQIETYCWHLDTLRQSQATVLYLRDIVNTDNQPTKKESSNEENNAVNSNIIDFSHYRMR